METLDCSVSRLNDVVEHKLKLLKKNVSTTELSDIHSFLKEAKGVREILISMGTFEVPEESDYYGDEGEEDAGEMFFNSFIQACHVIVDMYTLLDDNKIKEAKAEWIFEEVKDFLMVAQELFGARVPELPTMRLVSEPKKEPTKKTAAKTDTKKKKSA